MVKLWSTLIINGAMAFSEVPTKSQAAVHTQLQTWGFNDDGTPTINTDVTQ